MMKPSLWRLALLLVLLAVAGYLFLPVEPTAVKTPPSVGQPPSAPAAVPAPNGADSAPMPTAGPRTGRMEMTVPSPNYTAAPAAAPSFSYSLKKENNERTILPGVTYSPGQGVNIKTANANETVQLKREAGQTTDYQVMWQKKY